MDVLLCSSAVGAHDLAKRLRESIDGRCKVDVCRMIPETGLGEYDCVIVDFSVAATEMERVPILPTSQVRLNIVPTIWDRIKFMEGKEPFAHDVFQVHALDPDVLSARIIQLHGRREHHLRTRRRLSAATSG